MKPTGILVVLYAFVVASCSPMSMPDAAITIEVCNIDSKPISNARVSIWSDSTGRDKQIKAIGKNGIISMHAPCYGMLYYSVSAPDFYSSWGICDYKKPNGLPFWLWRFVGGWEPRNPTVKVHLKEKGEAVAMFAKWVVIEPPEKGQKIGYDMRKGDWVKPWGTGEISNIFFCGIGSIEKGDYELTWSFPNPGDGIQHIKTNIEKTGRSELKSPKEAPTEGYSPDLTIDDERKVIAKDGARIEKPDCIIFRVESISDENGYITGAYYGKMYIGSDFRVAVYLNPSLNSRSLEFDVKQNLIPYTFGGLVINDP